MSPQERIRVEEELVKTLNPDQLVLEGLERVVRTRPDKRESIHDPFIDGLPVGTI